MHSLGYAEDKINRCFFANSIEQLPINTGAVIVDTSESFESEYGKLDRIPIYDTLRIASFISNAVCQMPYEGGI
jgi:hypothetical protein